MFGPRSCPRAHPWFGPAATLVDWATPEAIDTADRPLMGWAGWAVVVVLPAIALLVAQGILGSFGWPGAVAVLLLHVWVLYHGVLAGRLHRRLDELYLQAGTAAIESCREIVLRWREAGGGRGNAGRVEAGGARAFASASASASAGVGAGAGAVSSSALDQRETARLGLSLPLLDGYRDVFAPLFWYLLLPGPTGPLVYWCARVAAARRTGVAATGMRLLDWIPVRLAAFGFALGGRFDDAVFGLRSSHAAAAPMAVDDRTTNLDPAANQRLLLLPAASGAIGVDLLDEASRTRLTSMSADLAADTVEPTLEKVATVRSLLLRSAGLWAGLVVVGWLLF